MIVVLLIYLAIWLTGINGLKFNGPVLSVPKPYILYTECYTLCILYLYSLRQCLVNNALGK